MSNAMDLSLVRFQVCNRWSLGFGHWGSLLFSLSPPLLLLGFRLGEGIRVAGRGEQADQLTRTAQVADRFVAIEFFLNQLADGHADGPPFHFQHEPWVF